MVEKKEKLSLEKALGGLSHLAKEDGETEFFVMEGAFVPSVAKGNWLEEQLCKWAKTLGEKSGATVRSIGLEWPFPIKDRQYGNYSVVRPTLGVDCRGSICIQMVIRGSIDTTDLTKSMGKAVSGAAKKQLALDILEKFPPHF